MSHDTWCKDRATLREITCAAHDKLFSQLTPEERDTLRGARARFMQAFDYETDMGARLAYMLDAKLGHRAAPTSDAAPIATALDDTTPDVLLAWLKRHELSDRMETLNIFTSVWENGRPVPAETFSVRPLVWSVDESSVTIDAGLVDVQQWANPTKRVHIGQVEIDLLNADDSIETFASLLGAAIARVLPSVAPWYTLQPNTTFSLQPIHRF